MLSLGSSPDTGLAPFGPLRHVFVNARSAQCPMSEAAALRRSGSVQGTMPGRGFRATAWRLHDELSGAREKWIQHPLAHTVPDRSGRANSRMSHVAEAMTRR